MNNLSKIWMHGSHGSHSSHTNSSSDSNGSSGISTSGTGTSTNPHTSTIGGVDYSERFNNTSKLARYNGTGSLTALKEIIEDVRSRVSANSDRAVSDSLTGEGSVLTPSTTNAVQIKASDVDNLLKFGKATFPARYQPYTISINVNRQVTSNGTVQHSNHLNTSKSRSTSGTISGSTDTSWTASATGKAGSTYSYTYTDQLYNASPVAAATSTSGSFSASTDTSITKAQANSILSALQNQALQDRRGPAAKSFAFTGTVQAAHSNHSSHSSY